MSTAAEKIQDAPYKVLYDAECEFCRKSMRTLKHLDKRGLTEAVPLSEEAIAQLNIGATIEECSAQMHVISKSGKLFIGYYAIVRLASLFPQTKALAWIATHFVPSAVGCALYRLVANNRYGIGNCTNGKCKIR